MTREAAPSKKGRRFFTIEKQEDGTADIYLMPEVWPRTTPEGATDYDLSFRVVRGIDLAACGDLDASVRANYDAWCEIGEPVWL